MKLEGTIKQFVGVQEGISKTTGNPWKLASYVLETDGQYPKKVYIEIFGEERIQDLSLLEGEHVALNVDAESREFNGRWYTSIRVWGRAESSEDAQPQVVEQPQVVTQPQVVETTLEDNSDLPF